MRAVDAVRRFAEDLDDLQLDYPELRKFPRAAHEFCVCVYIESNLDSLINYGERYRAVRTDFFVRGRIHGEHGDQQAFRQAPTDAVDTARRASAATDPDPPLDGTLRLLFERWHPGLAASHTAAEPECAAA